MVVCSVISFLLHNVVTEFKIKVQMPMPILRSIRSLDWQPNASYAISNIVVKHYKILFAQYTTDELVIRWKHGRNINQLAHEHQLSYGIHFSETDYINSLFLGCAAQRNLDKNSMINTVCPDPYAHDRFVLTWPRSRYKKSYCCPTINIPQNCQFLWSILVDAPKIYTPFLQRQHE